MRVAIAVVLAFLAGNGTFDTLAVAAEDALPVAVGTFRQEVAVMYGEAEGLPPVDPDAFYPVCTEAQRACPPEDIGGPPGYEIFLQAVLDAHHEQHASMLEWVGGEFDPDYVDREEINRWLESEFYETDWGLRQVTL